MKQYRELLLDVMANGESSNDRTGTGTTKVFGRQMRFDLKAGFPIVTGKKVPFKAVIGELLWFVSGDTNIKWLNDNGITIWDEWADDNGDLGKIYGHQWRSWNNTKVIDPSCVQRAPIKERIYLSTHSTIDQLQQAINTIKTNPDSRRIVVTAWNPSDLNDMALPPCHMFFQFQVSSKGLSCHVYQRSVDCFLGLPFNIASYAALTHMVAEVCNLPVHELIWSGGDVHIYHNHIDQVNEYLSRQTYDLPKLSIAGNHDNIDSFEITNFALIGYECGPAIKADVSI